MKNLFDTLFLHRKHFALFYRSTVLIIALYLQVPVSLMAQTATAPAGVGTVADPFQIATLNNLYWLSQTSTAWDKNFIQTADIGRF